MEKGLFQILDEMNLADAKDGTRLVAISSTFIQADKVKQGAKITMGVDEQSLHDIMNEKVMPILLIINKEEYYKLKKG